MECWYSGSSGTQSLPSVKGCILEFKTLQTVAECVGLLPELKAFLDSQALRAYGPRLVGGSSPEVRRVVKAELEAGVYLRPVRPTHLGCGCEVVGTNFLLGKILW